MASKLKRLRAIPQPHRNGMIWRVLDARFPKLREFRSARLARSLRARVAANQAVTKDGPRYLMATAHRTAGIGHALSEYNTGLRLAQEWDLKFLHAPFEGPWEAFLGFGSHYPSSLEIWKNGGFELVKLPRVDPKSADVADELRNAVASIRSSKPLVFMPFHGQNSFIQHTTGPELRKAYWSYKNRSGVKVLREAGAINVAVHVRRRNAMDMRNPSVQDVNSEGYRSRYIDLDYFTKLMGYIREAFPAEKKIFHIFSQGTADGFEPLISAGDARLHLDVDQYNTFHNMACADILITSPSSFSFKAGMLTPGLKLSRYPWWHEIPQDSEWCRIPEDPQPNKDETIHFLRENLAASQAQAKQLFPFEL